MLAKLRAFWAWASSLGIDQNTPDTERQKVRLLNQILTATLPIHIVLIAQDFILRDGPDVLVTMLTLVITIVALWFQSRQWYMLARVYVICFITINMLLLAYLYGPDLKAEYTFLVMAAAVMLLFEGQKGYQIGMYVGLFACFEFTAWMYDHVQHPFQRNLEFVSYHLIFFASLVACFLIGRIFLLNQRRVEAERQKLLKEFQKKNEELEQANRDLERFAFVASHDLKTPLRNINNFLGLIERRLPKPVNGDLQEYLQIASNNARHMYYLIEDILQYSLLENQPEVFAIDLNLIVRRVQAQLATVVKERDAVIHSEDLPIVIGHESQLELLFQNLIENGIKYNESARPEIMIGTRSEGERNLVFIADNGIGIDESYQAKIFDMFYRLHTQDRYSGTGIGLAICQKIIQKHQGDISLESQPGEGSVFQLSFPKVWTSVALEPA